MKYFTKANNRRLTKAEKKFIKQTRNNRKNRHLQGE